MDKTSHPRIPAATRGASNAARAAAALPMKDAKATRAAQESMRPESSMLMIDSMRRHEMIAEAAYYKALARGFTAGCEMQDWLQAEQEIDMRLM